MRIADKASLLALLACSVGMAALAVAPSPCRAQEAPSVSGIVGQVVEASPGAGKTVKKAKEDAEELPPATTKVPSSVKDVVERLNEATNDVTLEDLNAAREAAAKLDVLIDIEKKLTDLVTIRKEREEKTMGGLAGAIPLSALGHGASLPPPVVDTPRPAAVERAAPPLPTGPEKVTVGKIAGAAGKYVAYYKGSGGENKQIRQGDQMPDGSIVTAISKRGVTLAKNSKSVTIQVDAVSDVFGVR